MGFARSRLPVRAGIKRQMFTHGFHSVPYTAPSGHPVRNVYSLVSLRRGRSASMNPKRRILTHGFVLGRGCPPERAPNGERLLAGFTRPQMPAQVGPKHGLPTGVFHLAAGSARMGFK